MQMVKVCLLRYGRRQENAGARCEVRAGGCFAAMSVDTLYAHIHRLLDEHLSIHLTTYYVDCTQRRVYQVCIVRVIVLETDYLCPRPDTY
jgi:hypothetical protein